MHPRPSSSRVWCYLDLWHRGRDKAVTGKALASVLDMNQREMRRTIEYLREHEHRPIGSTPCETNPGYFVMIDAEDVRIGMGSRWRAATRAIQVMRRQAAGIPGLFNLEVEFGEERAA